MVARARYPVYDLSKDFSDFDPLNRLNATGETLRLWGDHIAKVWQNNKRDLENEIKYLQQHPSSNNIDRYGEARRALANLLRKEKIY